jgi:iduronate 2-sulfatase
MGWWLPCLVHATEPLNVLLLMADDLNAHLGCYGHPQVVSPHLDRLASEGILFSKAYCQYPSCGPSRASMLTGMRPDRTQVFNNRTHFRHRVPQAVTMPQFFRQHAYHTVRVGKIFHQDVPTDIGQAGLDDPQSWDASFNPLGQDVREQDQLTVYTPSLPIPDRMSWLAAAGEDGDQTDGLVASEAIRQLQANRDRPFFLAVGFYRPHIPYIAPRRYFSFYPIEQAKLPSWEMEAIRRLPSAALASTPVWPNFGVSELQARTCLAAYHACVSFVDAQVGRILEALEAEGLAERTIIVFTSDHGYHLGEHGLWRKNSLFEESLRVPLIFRLPKAQAAGAVCHRIVELIDLFPTLVELAGLPVDESMAGQWDGHSLRDCLESNVSATGLASSQVQFADIPGNSIRNERYRYTLWNGGQDGVELYDHALDPEEQRNVADMPEYRAAVADLHRCWEQAQARRAGER